MGWVLDLYWLLAVLSVPAALFLSFSAYRLNPKGKINRAFAFGTFLVAVWTLNLAVRGVVTDMYLNAFLFQVFYVNVVLITGVVLDIMQMFSGVKYRRFLNYVPAAILAPAVLLVNNFIIPPAKYWYTIVGSIGPFAWVVLGYFFIYLIWDAALIYVAWKKVGEKAKPHLGALLLVIAPWLLMSLIDVIVRMFGIPLPSLTCVYTVPTALVGAYYFRKLGRKTIGEAPAAGSEPHP